MSSADIELFADHAAWLGPQLPSPTRRGLVAWLSTHVEGETRARLHEQMPVLHPIHEVAETALLALLGRNLTEPKSVRARRAHPDRNVDWQATYVHAIGAPPHEFVSTQRVAAVATTTIRALAGLAVSWASALETFAEPPLQHRASRLRQTAEKHLTSAPVAFGTQQARDLARLDAAARSDVDVILKVLTLWDRAFGADGDRESLLALARLLRADDIRNVNALLETTVHLSIARIATSIRVRGTGPCWEPTRGSWTRANAIELQASCWRCSISKGLLSDAAGRRIIDGLTGSVQAMGLGSVGSQPDIVLGFWHVERPEKTVFVLGDAKRNVSGTGLDYLRDSVGVAAAYILSYGQALGLVAPVGAACHGTVNPMVTLFCAQGVSQVLGCTEPTDAVARLESGAALPPVMAFDLTHFGPTGATWQAPVLRAWFARIADQACAALPGREKARGRASASAAKKAVIDTATGDVTG